VSSDNMFRILFETSPEGILLVDWNRTIVDANAEACRTLIRTRGDILTLGLDTIFDLSDPKLEPAWEDLGRWGVYTGELRFRRGDETTFLADVSMTGYGRNGEGDSVGILFRDLSAREQIEKACVPENKVFWRGLMEKSLSMRAAHAPNSTGRHFGPSHEQTSGRTLKNLARGGQLLNRLHVTNRPLPQTSKESEAAREPLPELLTPREMEVLCLVAQGQSNFQIARTLTITVGTAKLHVHHIITKLGVCDRTQAALCAIKSGLF
jgi:DNA-binding CsgD family transcriptional regulator